jgi:hypothetical protein
MSQWLTAAVVVTALTLSSSSNLRAADCSCYFQKTSSDISAEATCGRAEQKGSDCRLRWTLKAGTGPAEPRPGRVEEGALIESLVQTARSVLSSGRANPLVSPMANPGFWLEFRSNLQKNSTSPESSLYDLSSAFLANPQLVKEFPQLVVPALVYATHWLIRNGPADNPLIRTVQIKFLEVLFGQLGFLPAFSEQPGASPNKFRVEDPGVVLEGRTLRIPIMGIVQAGCFEMWSDDEFASSYMVKAGWSPIKIGRCG